MMESARIAFHNGVPASSEGLWVDPFGPLSLWGEGLFDTFRVHEGRILYAAQHESRMRESLVRVWDRRPELLERVEATWRLLRAEASRFSSGRGRILVAPIDEHRSDFDVFAELAPFTLIPDEVYARGVSLGFSSFPHPGLGAWGKTTSAMWSRKVVDEAKRRGFDELVLCRDEIVVETAWSAVIWRENASEHWWTPASSLGGLPSTTLEALRAKGVRVDDVVATKERLQYADAIVLLSSLRLAIGVNTLGVRHLEAPDASAAALRALLLSA